MYSASALHPRDLLNDLLPEEKFFFLEVAQNTVHLTVLYEAFFCPSCCRQTTQALVPVCCRQTRQTFCKYSQTIAHTRENRGKKLSRANLPKLIRLHPPPPHPSPLTLMHNSPCSQLYSRHTWLCGVVSARQGTNPHVPIQYHMTDWLLTSVKPADFLAKVLPQCGRWPNYVTNFWKKMLVLIELMVF